MQAYAKLQMRTEEKDMSYNIAVIPGDGIGPEIVREAQKVLDAAGKKYGFELKYTEVLMGGASIDVHGVPLTDEAIATAKASDAVLMGSIGGDAKTSPWSGGRTLKNPQRAESVCKLKTGVPVRRIKRGLPTA